MLKSGTDGSKAWSGIFINALNGYKDNSTLLRDNNDLAYFADKLRGRYYRQFAGPLLRDVLQLFYGRGLYEGYGVTFAVMEENINNPDSNKIFTEKTTGGLLSEILIDNTARKQLDELLEDLEKVSEDTAVMLSFPSPHVVTLSVNVDRENRPCNWSYSDAYFGEVNFATFEQVKDFMHDFMANPWIRQTYAINPHSDGSVEVTYTTLKRSEIEGISEYRREDLSEIKRKEDRLHIALQSASKGKVRWEEVSANEINPAAIRAGEYPYLVRAMKEQGLMFKVNQDISCQLTGYTQDSMQKITSVDLQIMAKGQAPFSVTVDAPADFLSLKTVAQQQAYLALNGRIS